MPLTYNSPTIQRLECPIFEEFDIRVSMLREDLNHPEISGNKWWKLKYNLESAIDLRFSQLLTFGGAYSNHIYATAAAAFETGLKSVGIIRGEETLPINPILSFALSKGMKLKYVSREQYRRKTNPDFLESLRLEFGDSYLLPEGGTNNQAIKGCAEFGESLLRQKFDIVCIAVGTGGTMAGLISGLNGDRHVIGFSALKDGGFLNGAISDMLRQTETPFTNWEIQTEYHMGGYAKSSQDLDRFINSFRRDHGTNLEHVYTGKMAFGVFDLIKKNRFKRGSDILMIHSGGVHPELLSRQH